MRPNLSPLGLWHAAAAALLALGTAHASAAPANLYSTWWVPQAQAAASSAQQLHNSFSSYCAQPAPAPAALQASRAQWLRAVTDWERLSAVAMGPMVQRRSARVVDFQPLRPKQLQAALAKAPQTVQDMESIGGPAKGFPALEQLLWTDTVAPGTPACRYATLAAADIAQELSALHTALQQQATATLGDFFLHEDLINQWVGGVERLRWAHMDKPLRSAKPGKPAALPRSEAAHNLAGWQAHWSGLRTLAVGGPDFAGANLAALVAQRGWENLAQRLRDGVQQVDQQLAAITAPTLEQVQPAVQSLAQLKHLVESEVAPALDVTIGFSDADGD